MRGSVRKRGQKWSYIVDNGRDVDGRRKQKWVSGFNTKREAENALTAALSTLAHGGDPFPDKMTVSEYLKRWGKHHEDQVRPSTWKRYAQLIKFHIEPTIGNVRLDQVRPAHVASILDEMRANGLAPRTITQTRAVLGTALKRAVAWELIQNNPVQAIARPRTEPPNLAVPTTDELLALIEASKQTPWEIPVLVAATTGMRRGEVLAVRWNDLDTNTGRLRIQRAVQRNNGATQFVEPKTPRAKRQVTLPDFVLERLRQHKSEQAKRRLKIGEAWQDFDLIADHGDGSPLSPDGFTQGFKRIAAAAGLDPKMRLHDVRHGVATMMLEADVHMAIASAVLGHADPAFTMRTYQHIVDGMSDSASDAITAAFKRSAS